MKILFHFFIALAVLTGLPKMAGANTVLMPAPSPTISDFNPKTGPVGSTVTITGTWLTNVIEVQFNGTPTTVFQPALDGLTLTVVVPAGATNGFVIVINGIGEPTTSVKKFNLCTNPGPLTMSIYSAPAGNNLHVYGQNFNSTPTSNVVMFGDARASVASGTTTDLFVAVPKGADHCLVSVLNPATLSTQTTSRMFITTFPTKNSIGPNDFDPAVTFTNGSCPSGGYCTWARQVAIGDIDGDKKSDMAVSNLVEGIYLFRNTTSPFSTGTIYPSSFAPYFNFGGAGGDVALADLNGDGKPEMVLPGTVYQNQASTGTLNASSFGAGIALSGLAVDGDFDNTSYRIALADFNLDGKTDIAIASGYSSGRKIQVFLNQSSGNTLTTASFSAAILVADVPINSINGKIMARDMDGDGKPDLVLAGYGAWILRNTYNCGAVYGAGSFAAYVRIGKAQGFEMAIGDLNNDQKPDIVLGQTDDSLAVLIQNNSTSGVLTSATFNSPVPFIINAAGSRVSQYGSPSIDDMDGDGNPDFILASSADYHTVSVYRNKGLGGILATSSFENPVDLATSGATTNSAVGDIDMDGKPDVICLNVAANISIIRNGNNDTYCIPDVKCTSTGGASFFINYFGIRQINADLTNADQCFITPFSQSCAEGTGIGYTDPSTFAGTVFKPVLTGSSLYTYNSRVMVRSTDLLYGFCVGVWIDSNDDMDFGDAGEFLLSYKIDEPNGSTLWITDRQIVFPAGLSAGKHRVRVRVLGTYLGSNFLFDASMACSGFIEVGETKDFDLYFDTYCVPHYKGSTSVSTINQVSLGGMVNNSSSPFIPQFPGELGDLNYTIYDLPNKPVLIQGQTYPLFVTLGGTGQKLGVWLDANNDADFDDAGEYIGGSTSMNLVIPTTTSATGLRRLRIRCIESTALTYKPGGACGNVNYYGETEDYIVDIRSTPGVLASGNQTICNGATPNPITLAINPAPLNSGTSVYSYYYQDGASVQPTGTSPAGWFNTGAGNANLYSPPALTTSRTYACFIRTNFDIITGQPVGFWVTGVRQITVLPVFNPGTIASGDQASCTTYDPNPVSLSVNPSGSGAYSYKWYYWANSTMSCPTGATIPAGSTSSTTDTRYFGTTTTGAGISFDPSSSGNVPGRTWAVLITPLANGSTPACGTPTWAGSCRKHSVANCSTFNPGTLAPGNETGCSVGRNPSPISFSVAAASGSTYVWYYKNGVIAAPTNTDPIGTWLAVSLAATASTYDPPTTGISISFACRVTNGASSQWATGARQITILTPENYGTIAPGNQTFTGSGDPSPISFSTLPSGGTGTFNIQWFQYVGPAVAPSGNTIPAGWTAVSGQNSNTFDPSFINTSMSYAVTIDPVGTPDCGGFIWAAGVRVITVNSVAFNPGTVSFGNQTICYAAIHSPMSVVGNTSGATFQWYFKDGPQPAPAQTDPIGNWNIVSGATLATYTPGTLATTRTFACRVTYSGSSQWATGVRLVTVLPPFNPGTIAAGDQSLCANGNPANIALSIPPSGSSSYTYQWYYKNAIVACPTGNATSGWLPAGTGANVYDPQSANTTGRTFTVLVTPAGSPTCGTPSFANNCRKITVVAAPCNNSRMAFDNTDNETNMDESVSGLEQNFPNPFSSETTIPCIIPEETKTASLEIYGMDGRKLQQIPVSGTGKQEILISRKMLPATGIYMYTLVIDGQKQGMKRMVVTQ